MIILLVFSFLAGIGTMLSPCIVPILPIILAAGTSKGLWKPFGICLGLVISFTVFTVALTSIVHAIGITPTQLRLLAIAFVFAFGLFMLSSKLSAKLSDFLSPLARLGESLQQKGPGEGFFGGLVLGIALGLLWTPCAGPILGAIATLIATQSITFLTILLVFTYVLGASVPIFFIVWGSGKAIHSSVYLSQHAERIRHILGGVTMLVALTLAFHWDMILEQKIAMLVPSALIDNTQIVQEQLEKVSGQPHKDVISTFHPSYGKAPELVGVTNWIQSQPLLLKELKGKVVLIDFWTYTCINCLRTLPHLEDLYKKYKDDGLVIIGVHTPEFEFEKDSNNVKQAVSRLGIAYPVAQDNSYSVWQAYHNRFWPAHYLIDQEGTIVYIHYGEGGYVQMEEYIRKLLNLPPISKREPATTFREISPETYLGANRARSYSSENHIVVDRATVYSYSTPLRTNEVGLKGYWLVQEERITAEGEDCFLEYNFLGKQVYLVLSGASPIPLQVFLDGKPAKQITIDEDRKYDIVDTTYGPHSLSLRIPQGISAYAFTFGDE